MDFHYHSHTHDLKEICYKHVHHAVRVKTHDGKLYEGMIESVDDEHMYLIVLEHEHWHGHKHGHWDGHKHEHWHGHKHGHWDGHEYEHKHGHKHGHWDGHEHEHKHGHEHWHEHKHKHKHGHWHEHEHGYHSHPMSHIYPGQHEWYSEHAMSYPAHYPQAGTHPHTGYMPHYPYAPSGYDHIPSEASANRGFDSPIQVEAGQVDSRQFYPGFSPYGYGYPGYRRLILPFAALTALSLLPYTFFW